MEERRILMGELDNEENEENNVTINSSLVRFNNGMWLRLFHAAIEDDIIETFCRRNEVIQREELDARNSANRPLIFNEAAAIKFNTESFSPTSLLLPNLHEDFAQPIDLALPPGVQITPDQVQKRFTDVRAKSIFVIEKWERSGNGEGMIENENDEGFGCICGDNEDRQEFFNNDDRANFLNGFKSYVLYFWHIFEQHNVLTAALYKIKEDMTASSNGVPEVNENRNQQRGRNKDDEAEDRKTRKEVAVAFRDLSDSQSCANVAHLEEKIFIATEKMEGHITAGNDMMASATKRYLENLCNQRERLLKKQNN
mmetsp:Transcript_7375/g.11213  ORF Transcript_7375/g.11213 Transcript_7375/m.11213 type:complete len:312 (+) Transcript_7375:146-1081(+)